MTERINTPFTNEHFAAFCLGMVGQPYWYGTVVYKCTENLRSRKAAQYPSHYGSSRTARYRQDIENKKVCADCVGGCKGYAWTDGGKGVLDSGYRTALLTPACCVACKEACCRLCPCQYG